MPRFSLYHREMRAYFQKPENLFWALALLFGLLFATLTPPFQVSDEDGHFFRAYQIGEGKPWSERRSISLGGDLPSSLPRLTVPYERFRFHPERKTDLKELDSAWNIPLEKDKTAFVTFSAVGRYPPLAYLPAAASAALTSTFELPPLSALYLGRGFTLLAWIGLVYAAICVTPTFKWFFVGLSLIPTSIYLAGSISADALTNGLCFLLLAYLFKLAFKKDKTIGAWEWAAFSSLALLLAFCKPGYVLLATAGLMIPVENFRSWKWPALFALSALLAVGLQALWIGADDRAAVSLRFDTFTSYALQKDFVLHHPFVFLRNVGLTFLDYGLGIAAGFVGRFGWTEFQVPSYLLVLIPLGLIAIALFDGEGVKVSIFQKAVAFLVSLGLFLGICLSQYLTWTEPGRDIIQGLQGRYFLALAPLAFLVFHNPHLDWPRVMRGKIALAMLVFTATPLAISAWRIVARYYL